MDSVMVIRRPIVRRRINPRDYMHLNAVKVVIREYLFHSLRRSVLKSSRIPHPQIMLIVCMRQQSKCVMFLCHLPDANIKSFCCVDSEIFGVGSEKLGVYLKPRSIKEHGFYVLNILRLNFFSIDYIIGNITRNRILPRDYMHLNAVKIVVREYLAHSLDRDSLKFQQIFIKPIFTLFSVRKQAEVVMFLCKLPNVNIKSV